MTGPVIEDVMTTEECVYGLAASSAWAQDGVLFAARASGLYSSANGGASWQPLYASLALPAPLPTAAVATSPCYAYDQHLFAGVPGAVMRSYDRGQTWQAVLLASPAPTVTALAVSPDYERDGVVFAATAEDGVFRSKDRGVRWGAWNFGLLDLNTLCLALSPAFGHDQTLFVGTESGIFRSTNGGRAWRDVDFLEDHAPVQCLAISPGYVEDGFLAAGTESCGLFVSRDWGDSWARIAEDSITGSVVAVAVAVAGRQQRLLAVTDEVVLLSEDAGITWLPVISEGDTQFTACAAPEGLAAGATVFVGTVDGRILRGTLPPQT